MCMQIPPYSIKQDEVNAAQELLCMCIGYMALDMAPMILQTLHCWPSHAKDLLRDLHEHNSIGICEDKLATQKDVDWTHVISNDNDYKDKEWSQIRMVWGPI